MRYLVCTAGEGSGSDLGAGGSGNVHYFRRLAG
jgi:hypothetical protein